MFDTTFRFWQSVPLGAASQVEWSSVRADHDNLLHQMCPEEDYSTVVQTLAINEN